MGVSMTDGPGDILGDGSILFFRKGTHQGDKELAGAVHGVDILLFEVDRHPGAFRLRIVVRASTVFRANRDKDFVRIKSIFPSRASATIRLKPSRLRIDSPEIF